MQEVVRLTGVGRASVGSAAAGRYAIRVRDTVSPQERVIGETIRGYHEDTGGDWQAVLSRLEANPWLTNEQRSRAVEHARWLERLSR